MALTTTIDGFVVEISDLDDDWLWSTHFPDHPTGIRVDSIQYVPGGADTFFLREKELATGAISMRCKCADDLDDKIKYYNGAKVRPVLDVSDCTLAAAANSKIIIILTDRQG